MNYNSKMPRLAMVLFAALLVGVGTTVADVTVTTESSQSGSRFQFESAPMPAIDDTGSTGKWRVLAGRVDPNSGAIDKLFDGRVPTSEDQPVVSP